MKVRIIQEIWNNGADVYRLQKKSWFTFGWRDMNYWDLGQFNFFFCREDAQRKIDKMMLHKISEKPISEPIEV